MTEPDKTALLFVECQRGVVGDLSVLPALAESAQPVLAPWQHAVYQLILDVPLVPLTVPSYSGPPEPGRHPYHLADYPDALAAFRQGIGTAQG